MSEENSTPNLLKYELGKAATSLNNATVLLVAIERCCKSDLYTDFSKDIYDAYHLCKDLRTELEDAASALGIISGAPRRLLEAIFS